MKYIIFSILSIITLFTTLTLKAEEMEKQQDFISYFETATFAGGCFWCMESDFEKLEGVIEVVSGFTGGTFSNPSYKQVSKGITGHREAVQITYNQKIISYKELLEKFWISVDPTDDGGQFCDRGFQYSSAIFYNNDEQKLLAEKSKAELAKSGRIASEIVTPVIMAEAFYLAEENHQNYYKKHSLKYKFYRGRCGRDKRLEELWGE